MIPNTFTHRGVLSSTVVLGASPEFWELVSSSGEIIIASSSGEVTPTYSA